MKLAEEINVLLENKSNKPYQGLLRKFFQQDPNYEGRRSTSNVKELEPELEKRGYVRSKSKDKGEYDYQWKHPEHNDHTIHVNYRHPRSRTGEYASIDFHK
jgi:hypothetical protein